MSIESINPLSGFNRLYGKAKELGFKEDYWMDGALVLINGEYTLAMGDCSFSLEDRGEAILDVKHNVMKHVLDRRFGEG